MLAHTLHDRDSRVDSAVVVGRQRTLQFALAVAVVVLPLFAPQPLVGLVGPSLGLPSRAYGAAAMLTMLGYAIGLVLITPLLDLFENRRLILATVGSGVLALGLAAIAPSAVVFLVAVLLVGVATSAIQMLVPLAAMLAPENIRGRVIGKVMSGLMFGILLSRPIASLAADAWGWRGSYALDALALGAIGLMLSRTVPRRMPEGESSYRALVASLWMLLRTEPVLQRRALYQSLCMGAFGVFWTAVALKLAAAPFDLGALGIALFAFAGAAGVVVAPLAGWTGDRGWTRPATFAAHALIIAGMLLAGIAGADWLHLTARSAPSVSLGLLTAAAVLIDLGVIADQTLGRRSINLLNPKARGRLNGLFTGINFVGSAIGSALTGVVWQEYGWTGVCWTGIAFGLAACAAHTVLGHSNVLGKGKRLTEVPRL